MNGQKPFVIAVVGPTASGKTAVGLILAARLGGEIVSADSMQVYRGLDIGTAKPPAEVRERIPHHLIDIIDPSRNMTAAFYQECAHAAIQDILARGKVPVVIGGTGLYVSAALDNLHFPKNQETNEERMRLEAEAERLGPFKMHVKLTEIDPVAASNIHVNNLRRVLRALEVYELTGKKYSEVAGAFKKRESIYDTLFAGILYDKEELKRRIIIRTERMLEQGWVDEVKRLFADENTMGRNARQAIGYLTLKKYIDGEISREEAVEKIVKATYAYGRRQTTWFKADRRVEWFKVDPTETPEEVADEILLYAKSIGKART